MRTLSVIGARPQFVKIAPVRRAMDRFGGGDRPRFDDIIVHTGQHYDSGMSDVFFEELHIPRPAVNLGIGSGSHADQTGRMLVELERVILEKRPDVVVVYGDTNSTLAGALAAAKLNVPIAHVEAGLRSFNRAMPEEINRIVADHVSDVLYAPTSTAIDNLNAEGLGAKSVLAGDVMYDAVMFYRDLARGSGILARLGAAPGEYGLVTIHRAENTRPETVLGLLATLNEIAARHCPLVFPMHPRTRHVLDASAADWRPSDRLHIIEPVGYLDNLHLIENARIVLTDSGGLQKEAFFLGTPCVTLRTETEWPETVAGGGNRVVGTRREDVLGAIESWGDSNPARESLAARASAAFGGGKASERIVESLASLCDGRGDHA